MPNVELSYVYPRWSFADLIMYFKFYLVLLNWKLIFFTVNTNICIRGHPYKLYVGLNHNRLNVRKQFFLRAVW